MHSILFYAIWILNILFVLLKKKSKLLTVISFTYSIYIVYKSTATNDYHIYYLLYWTDKGGVEFGYQFLMDMSRSIGLSYNEFLLGIYLICFVILYVVYRQYTDNFQFFFSLYYIYNYNMDIITVRNFIVTVLLLVFFDCIIKHNRIKAIIVIMIAASIHTVSLFYLPIVFVNQGVLRNKKLLKYGAVAIVILCILAKVVDSRYTFASTILKNFLSRLDVADKSPYYNSISGYGFLLYFFLHIAGVMCLFSSSKAIKKNNKNNILYKLYHKNTDLLLDYAYIVNLYCFLIFPLIVINMSFYRIYRNVYVINFLIYCMACDSYRKISLEYYEYVFTCFACNLVYKLPKVHGTTLFQNVLDGLDGKVQI